MQTSRKTKLIKTKLKKEKKKGNIKQAHKNKFLMYLKIILKYK